MNQSSYPKVISQSSARDMDQCVITLACGKKLYFDLAATLARSFRVHHRNEEISFVIVTDSPEKVPSDVRKWAQIIQIDIPEGMMGFELKLDLDRYSPAKKHSLSMRIVLWRDPWLHSLKDSRVPLLLSSGITSRKVNGLD